MRMILFFATLILALCAATYVEAKTKKFKNGDIYEGEIVKGVIEGVGVMKYATGDVYNGSWSAGVQEGKGVMTYTNGDKYDGNWKDGKLLGLGKMTYANGDIYNGNWGNGLRLGQGVMRYANGDVYNGNWGVGVRTGDGVITYAKGDSYRGNWSRDKYNGKGIYTYHNGGTLKGTWKDGKLEGIGEVINSEYTGEYYFTNGNIDETKKATITTSEGGKYIGLLKDNNFYIGKFTARNGIIMDGEWSNNTLTKGKISYPANTLENTPSNISTILGVYDNGFTQYTELRYSNGANYVGAIENYQHSGEGSITNKSQSIKITGQWENDNLVQGIGYATINGVVYTIKINNTNNGVHLAEISTGTKSLYSFNMPTPITVETLDSNMWFYEDIKRASDIKEGRLLVISVDKPGTLISHISMEHFTTAQDVTIKGRLYDTDILVLSRMKNMTTLDLSDTEITASPETIKWDKEKNYNKLSKATYGYNYSFIPDFAFLQLEKLQHIKLPRGLMHIGNRAFCKTGLTELTLPKWLYSVGELIFGACRSLKLLDMKECSIYGDGTFYIHPLQSFFYSEYYSYPKDHVTIILPNNIKTINYQKEYPIAGTTIWNSTIIFPAGIEKIINVNFRDSKLCFESNTPPVIDKSAEVINCTITVPKGSSTAYFVAYGDSNKYIEQ